MNGTSENRHSKIPPPSKHQLALMIWLCVFPTLTVLNLALADPLRTLSPVPRTFVARNDRRADRDLRADAVSASAARAASVSQPRGLAVVPRHVIDVS
jgi:hypothetical protein